MPRKTRKSKKSRRRTLRRLRRKGGSDSQALKIPDAAFKGQTPTDTGANYNL